MVAGVLGQILQEIGAKLNLPNLTPDQHDTCLIKFENGIKIQIELDDSNQYLMLGSVLGSVPLGRYRIDLLEAALKANGLPPPHHGLLAFSKKTDHLLLFAKFHVRGLRGDEVSDEIPYFLEKAKVWSEALSRSEVPFIQEVRSTSMTSNVFGLQR